MKSKTCNKCGKTKPCTQFHKNTDSPDGLHSLCSSCKAENAKRYAQKPKIRARIKIKARAYHRRRKSDPEYLAHRRAYGKKYAKRILKDPILHQRVLERDRRRGKLPHRRAANRKHARRHTTDPVLNKRRKGYMRKWIRKNKHKTKVYSQVWVAIENGTLIRKPCEVCGRTKVEGHHDDYSKPLEVRWLCRKHHKAHHAKYGEK